MLYVIYNKRRSAVDPPPVPLPSLLQRFLTVSSVKPGYMGLGGPWWGGAEISAREDLSPFVTPYLQQHQADPYFCMHPSLSLRRPLGNH